VRQLHLAELRDSWSAWLGVCLGFVVTNFALALCALVELAGVRAVQAGQMQWINSASFTWGPAFNLVLCSIVGAVVIGSSTSLVVDSRRGSLARLALTGATPGQVVLTIMSQLAAVCLACAVLGDVAAYLLLDPVMSFLLSTDNNELLVRATPVYALWPVLLANLFAVGLALMGGFKQARRASHIPPVEALRQATGTSEERMTIGRWVRAGLCLVLIVITYSVTPGVAASTGKEGFSNTFQSSALLLIVAGAFLAQLAPALVGPLTRAWTALVPSFDPTWDLTRSTTVTKAARLTKSVVPVMLTIGIFFGMAALGATLQSTLRANGDGTVIEGIGAVDLLPVLGLPLLLSLSGGVGSLIMMSKQRNAELALSGIVGTTPGQRVLMPVLEGVVITVTAALLSLVMVAVSIGIMAVGVPAAGLAFAFVPRYAVFAVGLLVCLVITVAATLLPTLRSLRLPEPRVIARLVAE
jgi:putative ABC transport system permease protein